MQTRACKLYGAGDLRIVTEGVEPPAPGKVLIEIAFGGICGSDLHYYQDGGFGPVRVREPITPGHELSGRVAQTGAGVEGLPVGTAVAISPSQPCGSCGYCLAGQQQHCPEIRFLGSAMRLPHEQGGFREHLVIGAESCHPVAEGVSLQEAACAEPLAVCLHAAAQAPDLAGKTVLITGAGPIGALMTAVVRHLGAARIVVTDLHDTALSIAGQMGATGLLCPGRDSTEHLTAGKGTVDCAFECSAAAPALRLALNALAPQGTLVQVGVAGDTAVPLNLIVGKEIALRGSHRFHPEFSRAVTLINSGKINVRPIITGILPMEHCVEAFEMAGDRSRHSKVQLQFGSGGK